MIEHGEFTRWKWIVLHPENLTMGKYVDIGAFCLIVCDEGVVIEDDVEIGAGTKLYSISTIDNKSGPVILKRGCKIGANSVIMPNVTIGEGAIVGALSFVNKSVPDGFVYIQRRESLFFFAGMKKANTG